MEPPRLLLALPPFTQLNTPYPSIAYLARHLRGQGFQCSLRDFGIELALKIYSRTGLQSIFDQLEVLSEQEELPEEAWRALSLRNKYERSIDAVIQFLQTKDTTLAHRILSGSLLPVGPRLQHADLTAFGTMGQQDAARYLSTLYLEDISDIITEMIDPGFGFSRYQPQLATGPVSFQPIADRLSQTTIVDAWLDALTDEINEDIIGISVPFPGTLYAALRMGRALKQKGKEVWMGGGYVNTELRTIQDERFWDCVDKVTYDDGEGPILELLRSKLGQPASFQRTRTAQAYYNGTSKNPDFVCAADYDGLDTTQYIQVLDTLNPTHRLWSDGRWNKITLAHGCYWKKCAFCDIHLDYIERYEPANIIRLVDHIEELIAQTGIRGFHFVDEAAPPKLMKMLALELLQRDVHISWWGNIRFERSFTPDLCRLLGQAGLIAVTGGLEVASDRVLRHMNKGITVEQAARTAQSFQQAGVMVHAYLMYGFPTQSDQETIDSMEIVRQLFEEGLLDSAFWHRFTLTKHSDVYVRPEDFHIDIPAIPAQTFASNDIDHLDPSGGQHDLFDAPLAFSLQQWMKGEDLHRPLQYFFPHTIPKPSISTTHVRHLLASTPKTRGNGTLLWLGPPPLYGEGEVLFHLLQEPIGWKTTSSEEEWLEHLLDSAAVHQEQRIEFQEAARLYPHGAKRFQRIFQKLKNVGLLQL